MFRNLGAGKFEELRGLGGPGIEERHSSRGAAFGDFDNDGDVDILIMNMNEPPSLLRNDFSGSGHWLKVLLEGTVSNRSAIGAQVVAAYGDRKQAQAVLAQSSYLSVNDRRLHFGLGDAASANLEIHWPNGGKETLARRGRRPTGGGPGRLRHCPQGPLRQIERGRLPCQPATSGWQNEACPGWFMVC